jgi:PIN domain nuclease of toxin-antitoxin system
LNLLLDTLVYLWWLRDDRSLAVAARETIADPASVVYVSAATIWEAGIKIALGRLDIGKADLVEEVGANQFEHLPITAEHAWIAASLPRHHDDPFDRVLVAQALSESLVLVSRDPKLDPYDVKLLRA